MIMDIGRSEDVFYFILEGGHCCGLGHGTWQGGESPSAWECNDILACCVFNILWPGGDPNRCKRKQVPPKEWSKQ